MQGKEEKEEQWEFCFKIKLGITASGIERKTGGITLEWHAMPS